MTKEQKVLFEAFASSLIGLPIAHIWRGYGSAIFLEFGALTPSTRVRRDGSLRNPRGEMGLGLDCGWRIEGKRSILCGSSTDEPRLERVLAYLTKATITEATLFGRLPEIDLTLSSGIHVISLTTHQSDPGWTLYDHLGDEIRWMHVQHGYLCIGAKSKLNVSERATADLIRNLTNARRSHNCGTDV